MAFVALHSSIGFSRKEGHADSKYFFNNSWLLSFSSSPATQFASVKLANLFLNITRPLFLIILLSFNDLPLANWPVIIWSLVALHRAQVFFAATSCHTSHLQKSYSSTRLETCLCSVKRCLTSIHHGTGLLLLHSTRIQSVLKLIILATELVCISIDHSKTGVVLLFLQFNIPPFGPNNTKVLIIYIKNLRVTCCHIVYVYIQIEKWLVCKLLCFSFCFYAAWQSALYAICYSVFCSNWNCNTNMFLNISPVMNQQDRKWSQCVLFFQPLWHLRLVPKKVKGLPKTLHVFLTDID